MRVWYLEMFLGTISPCSTRLRDPLQGWRSISGDGYRFSTRTTICAPDETCDVICKNGLIVCGECHLTNEPSLRQTLGVNKATRALDLIATAHERWGESFPTKLRGQFAIAIYHEPSRRLWLVRDHFGARPIYYTHAPNQTCFSSSLPALLAQLEHRPALAIEFAAAFVLGHHQRSRTFYEGVHRVPAASSVAVTRGRINARTYWPQRHRDIPAHDYLEELSYRLHCAVTRAVGSGHTALMLSGGLDSSTVAALAPPGVLRAYSVGFPAAEECDETEHIQLTRRALSLDGVILNSTTWAPWETVPDLEAQTAEPICRPNLHIRAHVYRQMRADGLRVVVDGHDGDTVISHGYERIPHLLRSFRMLSSYREMKMWASERGTSWLWALRPFAVSALLPARVQRLRAERAKRLVLNDSYLQTRWQQVAMTWDLVPRMDHIAIVTHPFQELSMERLHCIGRHFGIAARHPFFDVDLVETAFAAPMDLRLHNGYNRYAVRRVVAKRLPKAIAWRRDKASFAKQARARIAQHHGGEIEKVLESPPALLSQLADVKRLEHDWRRQRSLGARQWMEMLRACSVALWAARNRF